uniref:Uncharacterized protein n=1 Tax=Globisporangium ultimum (strain ATCC 200006 / CBS 805.95 / DAOM BR144) TaxID=431595 RepID=K3WLV4_GLOUD
MPPVAGVAATPRAGDEVPPPATQHDAIPDDVSHDAEQQSQSDVDMEEAGSCPPLDATLKVTELGSVTPLQRATPVPFPPELAASFDLAGVRAARHLNASPG